jgi:hypothetical protein
MHQSDLSDGQEIALSLLQIFSGTLSLIGSSILVFKILTKSSHNQKTTPYDRIMLGLSSCDIIASCTYAVGPFMLPSETSQMVWASGNESTCSQLGLLQQLSFSAIWYNCLLSFYYLLTVRFQVKREEFQHKYEKWMHLSAIFFVFTAIIGYIGDWYSEMQLMMTCWVGDVPKGCDASGTCTGAGNIIGYIFAGIPWAITLCSLVVNNIIIYMFVRKSLLPSPLPIERSQTSIDIGQSTSSTSTKQSGVWTEQKSTQKQLTKEAAVQGFLYVSTFLISSLPSFVVQVMDATSFDQSDQGRLYPLLVLHSMLLPLQGFFNIFIYVKPNYNRFNAAHPEESMWFILKKALFDPNVPRISAVTSSGNGRTSPRQNDDGGDVI